LDLVRIVNTVQFRRRHLPHWEVEGARYFVTVRCADSLPKEAIERLKEIRGNLADITPRSPQFAAFQRQAFRTLEIYLDCGSGSCPLRLPEAAGAIVEEFAALAEWNVGVPHFTIMPNHWHALFAPANDGVQSLSAIMKRLKGRTGKRIRRIVGGAGPLWQEEWFDRWVRDDGEWDRCVAYIQNNPVKAGIVSIPSDHPWTR
jgi:REP element-mobilizing transposase RayT